MALEIERKFIVEKLQEDLLLALGATKKEIWQTYLLGTTESPVRRVRKVKKGNEISYFYTQKKEIKGTFVREEIECEISENRYLELQKERDIELNEIVKTRYVLKGEGHIFELDKFPFFEDFDVLEVELKNEDEEIIFPPCFKILKEITLDFRFTNVSLARSIPKDF